jgi:hypothetical protein
LANYEIQWQISIPENIHLLRPKPIQNLLEGVEEEEDDECQWPAPMLQTLLPGWKISEIISKVVPILFAKPWVQVKKTMEKAWEIFPWYHQCSDDQEEGVAARNSQVLTGKKRSVKVRKWKKKES